MTRCGIPRADGIIRLGILCDDCTVLAVKKLQGEGRRFWARSYTGPKLCEACHTQGTNERLTQGE